MTTTREIGLWEIVERVTMDVELSHRVSVGHVVLFRLIYQAVVIKYCNFPNSIEVGWWFDNFVDLFLYFIWCFNLTQPVRQ